MTRALAFYWRIMLLLAVWPSGPAHAHNGIHERIEALTQAIARDPRTAKLFLQRSDLHRQHREWSAASADLEAAAKLAPDLPGLDLARARLAIARGEDPEGLTWLDRHLSAHHGSAVGYTLRAELQERAGRAANAAHDHEASLRASADPRIEQYLAWASALTRGGDVDSAIGALDAGLARFGPVVSLEHPLVELLTSVRRWDDALSRLTSMLRRAGPRETLLTRRAEILRDAGRFDQAQEAFLEARLAWEQLSPRKRALPAMQEVRERIDLGMNQSVQSTYTSVRSLP